MIGMSARWAIGALLVAGASLRLLQYLSDASLWFDELALAKAIVDTGFSALLTQPLPFDQVAPKGFVLAQKLTVSALGAGDLALRLLPFLCSLAALPWFARFAFRALPPPGALVALLLFATATPLIAFSGIVKQYSVDVLAAVMLMTLALDLTTRPVSERRAWTTAATGAVLPWFSQASVLVIGALALPIALWLSADVAPSRRQRIAVVLGAWGASALLATVASLALMGGDTHDYVRVFYSAGFPSLATIASLEWPWTNLARLLGTGASLQAGLAYPRAPLYPILAAAGAGLLVVRHRRVAAVVLGPIAVTLGAATVQQYPFHDQLVLFLIPSLIIAIGATIGAVYTLARPFSRLVATGVALVLTLPTMAPLAAARPPYQVENLKPVLEFMRARHEVGDRIYVYYGAAPAVSRYAGAYGFTRGDYTVGGCHRGDSVRYLEEIDSLRGRSRVWLVFTHALPMYREQEDILAYLDTIGRRLDAVSIPTHTAGWPRLPAEAYLFDLSRPAQPAAADARTFPLTGDQQRLAVHDCSRGPQSMVSPDF